MQYTQIKYLNNYTNLIEINENNSTIYTHLLDCLLYIYTKKKIILYLRYYRKIVVSCKFVIKIVKQIFIELNIFLN